MGIRKVIYLRVVFVVFIQEVINGMHKFNIMVRKWYEIKIMLIIWQYLGSYSSEEEAAHAYDLAAKRYHGNKAILNFHNDESRNRMKEMMNQVVV